jgi:hypothetical protein
MQQSQIAPLIKGTKGEMSSAPYNCIFSSEFNSISTPSKDVFQ